MDTLTVAALQAMVVGDALGAVPRSLQLLVAALMVGTALWVATGAGGLRALAFLACVAVYSRANQAFEGPVLLTLTPEHGLVAADLLPVALAAGILLTRPLLRATSR